MNYTMKQSINIIRHIISTVIILNIIFFYGCKKEENIQTTTISVKSMGCDNCAYLIKKAIFSLNGVKDVEFDMEKKLVHVKYLPLYTNVESIEIAITRAGYDANDRPRDSAAVKELPECCQNH